MKTAYIQEGPAMIMPHPTSLLGASDVAQILGISIKTVHKLIREGKLACVQVTTRERRFTHQQVEDYIQSQSISVRVDRKAPCPVKSPTKKGGKKSFSFSCVGLREEMKQWR